MIRERTSQFLSSQGHFQPLIYLSNKVLSVVHCLTCEFWLDKGNHGKKSPGYVFILNSPSLLPTPSAAWSTQQRSSSSLSKTLCHQSQMIFPIKLWLETDEMLSYLFWCFWSWHSSCLDPLSHSSSIQILPPWGSCRFPCFWKLSPITPPWSKQDTVPLTVRQPVMHFLGSSLISDSFCNLHPAQHL